MFRNGVFQGVLAEGTCWLFPWGRMHVDVVDTRRVWLSHPELEQITKADAKMRGESLMVLDLQESERAMVWVNGRANALVGPELWALWTNFADVRVEIFDVTDKVRFDHRRLTDVFRAKGADQWLDRQMVEAGHVGLLLVDGELREVCKPGPVVTWRQRGRVQLVHVETREQMLELNGQELMTRDKVTLRLNAGVTFRVADPVKAFNAVDNFTQALYRAGQLVLRGAVGVVGLDELLAEKDLVAEQMLSELAAVADEFGVQVKRVGLRDLILPGDMKELMNRVTEAKKAAEAALITRREETAAARAHANTAKLLEQNPTLMRMRELEVLEKVAENANLTVMLGEGNLADRVVKVL